MKLPYLLLFGIVLVTACHNSPITKESIKKHDTILAANQTSNKWNFDKVAGSVLKFKNGETFNTHLYELSYIGSIENAQKAPFLIFSGRDCDECDANISIYIHSPADGTLEIENGTNRYQTPGSERDFENDSLLYKARAFYGQVLPGIKGVIWYQDQLNKNNQWENSIFLVSLTNGSKKDTIIHDTEKLKLTLALLKQGNCKEIKEMDYKSEP